MPGGVAGLEVVSKVVQGSIRAANSVQVFANCPANKVAIGAGYQLGNLNYFVAVNRPSGGAWGLQVYNTTDRRQTGPITLDVLCASAH